jgi:serine/threonine protein kinase
VKSLMHSSAPRTSLLTRRSLMESLLVGVHTLHASSLIHRDLKPANILVGGPDGDLSFVADFGTTRHARNEFHETYIKFRTTHAYLPLEGFFIVKDITNITMSANTIAAELARSRDLWAVGLTWAELALKVSALTLVTPTTQFTGHHPMRIPEAIVRLIGCPTPSELGSIGPAGRISAWLKDLDPQSSGLQGSLRQQLAAAMAQDDSDRVACINAITNEIGAVREQIATSDAEGVSKLQADLARLGRHKRLLAFDTDTEIDMIMGFLSLDPKARLHAEAVLLNKFSVDDSTLLRAPPPEETVDPLPDVTDDVAAELRRLVEDLATVLK